MRLRGEGMRERDLVGRKKEVESSDSSRAIYSFVKRTVQLE